MKIALIRREYITHLDGVNRFVAWLAEGFHRLGHEPIIFSWCYSGSVEREELAKWFREMHGLDTEIPVYTIEERPCVGGPWARMLFKWYTKGSSLLKSLGVDIAIVNGVVPLGFKPKIAVAHGPLQNISVTQKLVLRVLYSMYDLVVCVSEKSEREYRGIAKCSAIIPLPMKLSLYRPKSLSEREDIVVHIGTRPVKNPDVSVRVVDILRERGHKVELVIVGSHSKAVEELAKSRSYVKLLFNADEKTKIDVLCRAKALILPSSGEAFPFTSLEAMACGTPPIVSQAVPKSVVVDGYNGVRVANYDPRGYADALEKLLISEELWEKLSRNGVEFVKRFNYIEIAKKYLELLESLVKA